MQDYPMNCPLIDPSRAKSCRWVCWTPGFIEASDDEGVNLKICAAFSGVKIFPFKKMIFQFWRPISDGGRLVLECYRNPHAVSPFDRLLGGKYRALCTKYRYSIDNPNSNPNPPWIISGGPVATAFSNHYPEVVLDLRVHRGSPLVDCGLDCDLACGVMLSVFDLDKSCVGVIECSMKNPAFLPPIFNELRRGLEINGLSIYHFQESWPYGANLPGVLDAAKMEIEKGLKIACESHDLTLGQVWVSHTQREQIRLVKLSRYFVDFDNNPLRHFYDKFDVISGEGGLAWKTLATHQPHLCRNIYKLSDNSRGVLALISANIKSSCFVICLRSTHTGELDYAFEFFWPCSRDHLIVSETLLLTLKMYLPSFNFASGDVTVVDVENHPSSISEDDEDDDDLAILAAYRNQGSLFYLPRSSTFNNVMLKLHEEFELDPTRNHTVEYEVSPGQWSSLVPLESCRRTEGMGAIKLRVRPQGVEVGWRWKTNRANVV